MKENCHNTAHKFKGCFFPLPKFCRIDSWLPCYAANLNTGHNISLEIQY